MGNRLLPGTKIRNTKLEIRNKSKVRIRRIQNELVYVICRFGFSICFGFRVSHFEFWFWIDVTGGPGLRLSILLVH